MLIMHEFVSEFCLSLTQTDRIRVSVYRMNLRKQHNITGSTYGKRNGNDQQEQSDNNTRWRIIELTDCRNEAAVTGSKNSDGLHDKNDHLEKENEEKHHEVEAGIATERFIRWPIPSIEIKLIVIVTYSEIHSRTTTYQHINDAGVNIKAYNMAKPNAENSPAWNIRTIPPRILTAITRA